MKKIIALLLSAFTVLFAVTSFAYTAPPKPDNGWYILDQSGKLTQSQLNRLNHKLDNISKSTKNEIGVAVLNTIDGEQMSDVGQTIFRSWGIGKAGLDNGVLLVIAMAEHKTRIQTGKGVEGDLPDLKASDILSNVLKPHMKSGEVYEGIDATIDAITGTLDSRANAPTPTTDALAQAHERQPAEGQKSDTSSDMWHVFLVVLSFFSVVGIIVFLSGLVGRRRAEKLQALEDQLYWEEHARKMRQANQTPDNLNRDMNLRTSPETPAAKPYTTVTNKVSHVAVGAGVTTGVAVAVTAAAIDHESAKLRREKEARKRREEEESIQKKNREEKRRSTYTSSYESSSSTLDSGSSGGDFGGGDSGGGGADGGW